MKIKKEAKKTMANLIWHYTHKKISEINFT